MVAALPRRRGTATLWDGFESSLPAGRVDDVARLVTAEIVAAQTDTAPFEPSLDDFDRSATRALRAYWRNAAPATRAARFLPEALAAAAAEGRLALPRSLVSHVQGRRVLEIGRDLGHAAFGWLAAGATEYCGLDAAGPTPAMLRAVTDLPGVSYRPAEDPGPLSPDDVDVIVRHDGPDLPDLGRFAGAAHATRLRAAPAPGGPAATVAVRAAPS
jgi:hypothetical protein